MYVCGGFSFTRSLSLLWGDHHGHHRGGKGIALSLFVG